MIRLRRLILGFFIVVSTGSLMAQEKIQAKNLRATIQKWVAVMKETQTQQQRWKREKQILQDSQEALKGEAAQLQQDIAATRGRLSKVDEASAEKLETKRKYDEARTALKGGLKDLDETIAKVVPLLPEELLNLPKVKTAVADFQQLSATPDEKLNKRLGAMLTILNEAEKFNQIVNFYPAVAREVDGGERLLDIVYFGLSLGYASDEEGASSWVLQPGKEGWKAKKLSAEDEVRAVRELLNVASKSGEVKLVNVPLSLNAEEK